MLKPISVKLAKRLLILENEELDCIQQFITEFQEKKLVWDAKSPDKFSLSKKQKKAMTGYEDLVCLVKKHNQLNALSGFMYYQGNQELLKEFVGYIKTLKKKMPASQILFKLKELGIHEFQYSPRKDLDTRYSEKYQAHACGKGTFDVRGVWSDGQKEWFSQIVDDGCSFKLHNANYIIEYYKGYKEPKQIMTVRNLEFDASSLPTSDDLYNTEVYPEIDYEVVEAKTKEVNEVYSLHSIMLMVEKVITEVRLFFSGLGVRGCEAFDFQSSIVEMENFIQNLSNLSDYLVSQYGIESEELKNTLSQLKVYRDESRRSLLDSSNCDSAFIPYEKKIGNR